MGWSKTIWGDLGPMGLTDNLDKTHLSKSKCQWVIGAMSAGNGGGMAAT